MPRMCSTGCFTAYPTLASFIKYQRTHSRGEYPGCRHQRFLDNPSVRRTNLAISQNTRKFLIAKRKSDDSIYGGKTFRPRHESA
jgi:hypothetical protein